MFKIPGTSQGIDASLRADYMLLSTKAAYAYIPAKGEKVSK